MQARSDQRDGCDAPREDLPGSGSAITIMIPTLCRRVAQLVRALP
jgi:hypothetical protein